MPSSDSKPTQPACGLLLAMAVIAGLALVAVWLGAQHGKLSSENADLRLQREFAELATQTARNQLQERTLVAEGMINELARQLRDSPPDLAHLQIALLHPPTEQAADARATVVWDPVHQVGVLAAENLSVPAAGMEYHLELIDPTQSRPIIGGTLRPGTDGRVRHSFRVAKPGAPLSACMITLVSVGAAAQEADVVVLQGRL